MKNFKLFLTFLFAFVVTSLCSALAFADGGAVAASGGVPALAGVAAAIAGVPGEVWIGLSFALETVQRLWPTANPQGFLIKADAILKKVGVVIGQLGDICLALDKALNHVIPQNIAPPSA